MSEQQAGRVAVITGAASGIGRGLAEHAAGLGLRLVLADRDGAGLEELAGQLRARGCEVLARVTDVASAADVEALRDASLARFGGVDLLFNNAGVMQTGASWELSEAQWRRMLDINLLGAINGLRAFVPTLLAQGRPAHVINTASLAGLLASPFLAAYTVTKQALVALSEVLHHEMAALGAPIGVSVLCPGPVASRIMASDEAGAGAGAALGAALEQSIRQGMPAAELAAVVFQAIAEKRFWILPHPDFKPALRARTQSILDETNPVFQLADV
ncbi:SDR family NAD(P)-dependent oxidoreductase [Pseudomonas citronellolis]|uniref:SDR family NAD(P)-dependent oxidoreductase n=1 Tax=Pseudomonas citronellolis TaxID=53408 RepID=UPI0023E3566E|nr:SDR family NAD(P)-dependent oxidoreductase [Pseudomonas citronellolis]MDF3936718.1 SDR family NAD(P)-dependent oxidoreductase [Pseudomonas citronellolis]